MKKGQKASDEARKNMSLAHIGLKNPNSIAALKKFHKSGKESNFFIHGLSKDNKYRSFIKNKRNRDKRSNGGSHTYGEWELLLKQYNFTCPCCKKQEPEIKLVQDHIVPISKGGSDNIENIQPLCNKCNLTKMTQIIRFNI